MTSTNSGAQDHNIILYCCIIVFHAVTDDFLTVVFCACATASLVRCTYSVFYSRNKDEASKIGRRIKSPSLCGLQKCFIPLYVIATDVQQVPRQYCYGYAKTRRFNNATNHKTYILYITVYTDQIHLV